MSKPSTKDTCGGAETDSEEEPAQPQKAKRVFRAWQPLGQWDPDHPVTEMEDFVESELMRIAKGKMTVAGDWSNQIVHFQSSSNRSVSMQSERYISQSGFGFKCYSLLVSTGYTL